MSKTKGVFWRYEGPTWLVALAFFAGWFGLVWYHADIPWFVLWGAGGLIAAWHNSLVHESVHNLKSVPRWLRLAVVLPPLGVWYPYFVYFRFHTTHHNDVNLTDPARDPESFYFSQADWRRLNPLVKSLMIANQTFVGRMVLGPPLAVWQLYSGEGRRLLGGDRENAAAWLAHACGLAVLFGFVSGVAGLPWWQYLLLFAHPGLALTMVRSFYEHRAGDTPEQRVASVESGPFWSLLFLNNNLHIVHHLQPSMPWYEIPGYYRDHREELGRLNGGYVLKGYGEVIGRYLLRPTFTPVHPTL